MVPSSRSLLYWYLWPNLSLIGGSFLVPKYCYKAFQLEGKYTGATHDKLNCPLFSRDNRWIARISFKSGTLWEKGNCEEDEWMESDSQVGN